MSVILLFWKWSHVLLRCKSLKLQLHENSQLEVNPKKTFVLGSNYHQTVFHNTVFMAIHKSLILTSFTLLLVGAFNIASTTSFSWYSASYDGYEQYDTHFGLLRVQVCSTFSGNFMCYDAPYSGKSNLSILIYYFIRWQDIKNTSQTIPRMDNFIQELVVDLLWPS